MAVPAERYFRELTYFRLGMSIVVYSAATRAAFLRGSSEPEESVCCSCDTAGAASVTALRDKSISRSANETRENLLSPASRIRLPADAVITVSTRLRLSPTMLRSEMQASEHRGPSVTGVHVALVNPTRAAKSLVTCDATRGAVAWSQAHHAGEDEMQATAVSDKIIKALIFMSTSEGVYGYAELRKSTKTTSNCVNFFPGR